MGENASREPSIAVRCVTLIEASAQKHPVKNAGYNDAASARLWLSASTAQAGNDHLSCLALTNTPPDVVGWWANSA